MLRVCRLATEAGVPIERGGVELIERWQREGGCLWLDIQGELGDSEQWSG
jgi:hypothetical protein